MTNAVRHARVTEARVTLRSAGDLVVAEIRDEGCGFAFDGRVGLMSMHERAVLVGGSITVDRPPGKGTTIRATVPTVGPDEMEDPEPW